MKGRNLSSDESEENDPYGMGDVDLEDVISVDNDSDEEDMYDVDLEDVIFVKD